VCARDSSFVIAKTVREVLDAAFGPGSLLWLADAQPLVESRIQETGESKRNETREWDGDNGCYSMCFPMSPFLGASGSFISQSPIGCTV
jgi:hypothetical protein